MFLQMHFLAIIAQCVLVAVLFGIVHDQITARICIEYFTIGHPPVFDTTSPTLLDLGWGVIATWWAGTILGVPLALAARVGRWPKLTTKDLWRPLTRLLLTMATLATLRGVAGYSLARWGDLRLWGTLAERIPAERHALFLADGFAHSASYLAGFVGGLVLAILTVLRRRKLWKAAESKGPGTVVSS